MMCGISFRLGEHRLRTKYNDVKKANLTSTERLDMNGNLIYSDIAYNGSILHQMAYTHNANTGNVLSRTGMYASKENFTYDDADRLTGVSGGMTAEYRYAPNGNITFMTGMGNFAYESSKPHAVTGVENTTGQIDRSTLYTTYNSIGKISTIHDPESGFRMNFNYGPDNTRCDALLYNGFDTIQHITYIPGCDIVSEKDQDGEYFHQWYYYIGDGVLYYRDSYGNTDTYYTYTDNIGSITRLYDGNGNLQFSAKYDPWGKQSIVTNNIGLIRGYTGHEHIWPFGLINMNGRLYDPLVGRFLSTDNFVQEPLNAQNFNRYSYCLNNPLKYNDPSGEWFGFDDLFAMITGGTINLLSNLFLGNVYSFWHGLSLFGVGAAAGEAALYSGPAAVYSSSAIVGLGNSLVNQGFENGWDNISIEQAGIDLLGSLITGHLGKFLGSGLNDFFSGTFSKISSPVIKEMTTQSISSASIGFFIGTGSALANEESFNDAITSGFIEARNGLVIGAVSGLSYGYQYAKENKISPWTGERLQNHHSFPKFLGGMDNQILEPMSESRHRNLHSDLLKHISNYPDGKGGFVDMRYKRGGERN